MRAEAKARRRQQQGGGGEEGQYRDVEVELRIRIMDQNYTLELCFKIMHQKYTKELRIRITHLYNRMSNIVQHINRALHNKFSCMLC